MERQEKRCQQWRQRRRGPPESTVFLEEEVWNCHHISVVKEIKCPSNLTMK
jgi:hypothetical protein